MSFDERTLEALDAYLDGELDERERAELETQLAASAELRSELHAIEDVRDAVRSLPQRETPEGFPAAMLPAPNADAPEVDAPEVDQHQLAARRHQGGTKRPWRRMGLIAGAAAASVVALAAAFPSETQVRPPLASMVRAHAAGASQAADPISLLAPVAQPVKFGR